MRRQIKSTSTAALNDLRMNRFVDFAFLSLYALVSGAFRSVAVASLPSKIRTSVRCYAAATILIHFIFVAALVRVAIQ